MELYNNKYIKHHFKYGSAIYNTNTENSDIDIICIVDDKHYNTLKNERLYVCESKVYDCTFLTHTMFQNMLDRHEIIAIECYFSYYPQEFNFTLNKKLLRTEISKVSSNSWQKTFKKLTVMSDYDKHLAIKSAYHSIRILSFGIQLCTHGKIVDFTDYSWLLKDLKKLSIEYDYEHLWLQIKSKYEALYKSLRSEFRNLAPKDNEKFNVEDYLMDYILKTSETNVDENTFKIRKKFAKEILNRR